MNAIKKEIVPEMELLASSSDIAQNCISLEESKQKVLNMVHKHFHK